MNSQNIRDVLENRQIVIYFSIVIIAAVIAIILPGTHNLEVAINPALAVMLFVTFLQVPLAELRRAITHLPFLMALLVGNFIGIPLLVFLLLQLVPDNPLVRLGVLMVLLSPCIDYVVTFTHLGGGDTRLLLAATPVLLLVQIVMLPLYLGFFLGEDARRLVQLGPFLEAFLWLIALPLVCAALFQWWAARSGTGNKVKDILGVLPVPATGIVLFVVIASVIPQIGPSFDLALRVIPVYIGFAIIAPLIGWFTGRLFRLEASAGRSVAFSTATRNSLVILPLALAVPGAVPVLPAIIVTQTLIELICELIFVRIMPLFGTAKNGKKEPTLRPE
ncbi:MAG: arsenic resistance protein [Chloroflexi bacterium]|nr:arsenic resistance protein [Chloroflexota bacterium]OJV99116.1 MAG: arsenic resistance protein [Chloroflexi bacterium 54-19]